MKLVLRNVYVAVDGTDVSASCRAVELQVETEAVEVTSYVDTCRVWTDELRSATVSLSAYADAASDLQLSTAFGSPPALVQLWPSGGIPGGSYGFGTYGNCPYGNATSIPGGVYGSGAYGSGRYGSTEISDTPLFEVECTPRRQTWGGAVGDAAANEWELIGTGDVVANWDATMALYDFALYDVDSYGP